MSQSGTYIKTSGAGGEVESLTGNTGGAVVPTAGNINVVGSGVITTSGSGSTLTISASGAVADSFVTDSGTATPIAGVLDVNGAHGLNTTGSTNHLGIAINNTITLGDLVTLGSGVPALTLASGDLTISSGNINFTTFPSTSSKSIITLGGGSGGPVLAFYGSLSNTFLGSNSGALRPANTSSANNTGVGIESLYELTTGNDNTAIGGVSLEALSSGSNNVAVGYGSLQSITTGTNNTAIGYESGTGYQTSDSNNISIGYTVSGTTPESNTIRIGNASNNQTFITGITGVNVGSVASVVSISSGNQLGSTTITAGTGITITPGANTITIAATTTPSTVVETLTGNSGGAISPTANNINLIGAGDVNIVGTGSTLTVTGSGTTSFVTSSGTATASSNSINVTQGSNILTTGSGSTVTVALSATPSVTSITLSSGSALSTFTDVTAWTPVLNFGGATTGITYTTQKGVYSRIGNIVTVTGNIVLSSVGSATGNATITGIPVAAGTNNLVYPFQVYYSVGTTFTSGSQTQSYQQSAILHLNQVAGSTGTVSQLTNANFSSTSQIYFSGTYMVY